MRTQYSTPSGPPAMPPLAPWLKKLLLGLGGLYIFELVLLALNVPVLSLIWQPLGGGFAPWQLVTHMLVCSPNDLFGVAASLLMLYFLLPTLRDTLGKRALMEAFAAAWLGRVALTLPIDALLWTLDVPYPRTAVVGWTALTNVVLIVLFALGDPRRTLNLYFVLPVKAVWLLWGTLAICGVLILSDLASGVIGLGSIAHAGAWVGTYAWWYLRGPGRRRNDLRRQGRKIEKELKRFRVIDGGNQNVH